MMLVRLSHNVHNDRYTPLTVVYLDYCKDTETYDKSKKLSIRSIFIN